MAQRYDPKKTINREQIEAAVLHTAHDRYFKSIMEFDYISTEFLSKHLPPALLKKLDLKTLMLEKDSLIRDSLKRKETDVLFSVNRKEGTSSYI